MNEPLLLVLDIDETLIHATTREDVGRHCDFHIEEWKVFVRPHLEEFLDLCFDKFRVGVWTSAGSDYADIVVSHIIEDRKLEFVWSSDQCTRAYDIERFEYYPVKNLKKLLGRGFRKEKILAVDDTPEKWERSYGNYVPILEYRGSSEDSELKHLIPFLDKMSTCENVRKVEKRFWRNECSQNKSGQNDI